MRSLPVSILIAGFAMPAIGGEADVIAATATPESGGTWRFDVTVHGCGGTTMRVRQERR